MISEECKIASKDIKKMKPKRAEIQIYRPGALRQLREATTKPVYKNSSDNNIHLSNEKDISQSSMPITKPSKNDISCSSEKNQENYGNSIKSRVYRQTNPIKHIKDNKNLNDDLKHEKKTPVIDHKNKFSTRDKGESTSRENELQHSYRKATGYIDGKRAEANILEIGDTVINSHLPKLEKSFDASRKTKNYKTKPLHVSEVTSTITNRCRAQNIVKDSVICENPIKDKLMCMSNTKAPSKNSEKIVHSTVIKKSNSYSNIKKISSSDKSFNIDRENVSNKAGSKLRIKENIKSVRAATQPRSAGCKSIENKISSVTVEQKKFKKVASNKLKKYERNCITEIDAAKLITEINLSSGDTSKSDVSDDELCTSLANSSFIKSHESSFYNKNIPKNVKTSKQQNSDNVYWGDEKWSPAQRRNREKSRILGKESFLLDNCSQRGIISLPKPALINQLENNHSENPIGSITKPKKHLFNPDNPNKPVPVIPSARDLPPSSSCNYKSNDSTTNTPDDEIQNFGHNISDTSVNNTSGKIDPSIFYSIQKGELDVNYYVSSNQLPQEFRRIMDIREHLKKCYRQLLLTDIRLCQEKNIENALWKSLYYVIIEKLREYITREPPLKDRSQSTLLIIVGEGLDYLQSLLNDLQSTYKFSLSAHCEEDSMAFPGLKNRVRLALYSCQKLLLCMGDLARYKEQHSQGPNYSIAKKWYEKALEVHPRNGRPFNQLAIIAVSQKRPLDVVYYYIRSLTAANPFISARDSLITMFEDIRRKYMTMDRLPSHNNNSAQVKEEEHSFRDGSLRREIWIRPDSGATNKRTLSQSEDEKENNFEEFKNLTPDQLMKLFLTSYLHCHGMLFSRVGLDHFVEVLIETLKLFQYLLNSTPQRLSSIHLLQIMATNMFAVDNTQLRDNRLENGLRSAAQDFALLLSQDMFGYLCEAMVHQFPQNLNCGDNSAKFSSATSPNSNGLFLPQLAHFVPAAKVWCDWLMYHSSVWNPPPVSHEDMGFDSWGSVGELATLVKGLGPPDIPISETPQSSSSVIVSLPEDSFLRGYSPLLSAHRISSYVPSNCSMERARDWIRLNKLQLCLSQFLCGVEPPILRLQKTERGEILVPIVAVTPPESPRLSGIPMPSCGSNDVDESFSESESEDDSDNAPIEDTAPLASAVRLLARRKKMLEKKQRQQRKMQALLEGSVTLEMEICPRYLIPDTNCFIEHLSIIQQLELKKSYTIMVPLTVLGELDGLSRDADVEKYKDASHAVKVREGAANAFHYITASKHQQLKCVTSQGSILPSTMFTSEIDNFENLSNDDKILSCCLHLCNDANKRRPIQKGMRRLYREVVLLTEDRNLRVKAYARDVPVRDLLDFSHWAGIK